MNDPHVEALHYWVEHDGSVDYSKAQPFEYEFREFWVRLENRKVTVRPKGHYASEDEAKAGVESFIRDWEFDAAVESGSTRFALKYSYADIFDRSPDPSLHGQFLDLGTIRAGFPMMRGEVRVSQRPTMFPKPPSGPQRRSDDQVARDMLYRLDGYYRGREKITEMAYFCLTALEDNAPRVGKGKRPDAAKYFNVAIDLLNRVGAMTDRLDGRDSRKYAKSRILLTEDERNFLKSAVRAFIRRVAERAATPDGDLQEITQDNLSTAFSQT